jgi:DNA repair protein RadC
MSAQRSNVKRGRRNAPSIHPPDLRGIAPEDRPREKLLRAGAAALGDHELLAIVIGSGIRRASALALAGAVLEAANGLHGLARLSRSALERIGGVGAAKASQIVAAIELGRRTLVRPSAGRTQFAAPRDAARFLMPQFGSRAVEHFGIVLLDTKPRVLHTKVLTIGTLDSSPVHPREVFREAAVGSAAAIVLFHNHPSGDPTPSPDDLELTARLVDAGELMGIDVLDHIILGESGYCSLKEAGKL